MRKILLIAAMLLLALPILAQDGRTDVIGGDEDQLREYIEITMGGYGPPGFSSTIYIGQPPEGYIPFFLEMPEGARVIGGSVNEDPMFQYVQTTLITDMTPDEVLAFYDEAFSGDEWRKPEDIGHRPGGFVEVPSVYSNFCYNDTEAIVDLNARQDQPGETVVFLNVRTPGTDYPCSDEGGRPPFPDPYRMLPLLSAPDGVTLLPGSAGGGGGGYPGLASAASTGTLQTERTVEDFGADYVAQLEAAGWQQVSIEMGAGFMVSAWTVTDEDGKEWGGNFNITPNPAFENSYLAHLYVQEIHQDSE